MGGGGGVSQESEHHRDKDDDIDGKQANDHRRVSKQALFSETLPRSVTNSPQLAPSKPSSVLLEIRPAHIEDDARVAATFPPTPMSTVEPADYVGIAKCHATRAQQGDRKTGRENLAQHQLQLPRVILGPVVGRVGPISAVVLVEVSVTDTRVATLGKGLVAAIADTVGVQLTDALSGQRHELTGGRWVGEPGSGPRVFEFEKLTPGRRYVIRLMGVRQRDQVNISRTLQTFSGELRMRTTTGASNITLVPQHLYRAMDAAVARYFVLKSFFR